MTQSVGRGTLLASRFRLEDLLGEASGARFWRATDLTLARSAALHVIPADDPRADLLLRAARVSANLTEPRLLRVLDAAREDGVVYVVSEWGSGSSLDRLLAEGALPPRRAAWVVKEVAEAIAHAHRQGAAHGRLLPENVMVTEAGSVKLIGFAVDAVLYGSAAEQTAGSTAGSWRASGYGDDVFDLGALLYAALVGRWPGASPSGVPAAPRAQGRVLRTRQVRAGVPRSLDLVCDQVLNPADHPGAPATAAQVAARLADYLGDGSGALPFGAASGSLVPPDAEQTTVLGRPAVGAADAAGGSVDPDATQAGAPVFDDDEGWAPRAERRPRAGRPDPPRDERRDDLARPPPAPRQAASFTGLGAGALPPDWGPDDRPHAAPAQPAPADADRAGPGRSWLRLAVLVAAVLLLAVAVVVAFQLGRDAGDGSDSPSSGPGADRTTVVPVRAASDFDPEADPPEENPAEAPLAVDGDPATSWSTVTYRGRPDLGGLKDGVGLLLDLGDEVGVAQVRATLVGRPYDLSLLAAPEGTSRPPTDLGGLREVASAAGAGPRVDLAPPDPVTTRFLVVWLTSLPPADGGYQGRVAEIVVRS